MSNWKPIESVPRDMQPVLVRGPGTAPLVMEFDLRGEYLPAREHLIIEWCCCGGGMISLDAPKLTEWTELPE